ncbi:hypothetical protein FG445_004305 [Yersinia enterocolitica]|nr:hypothetical protein [Yersinia enterocolitica]EKN4798785.1 hypothetical protein [Yersinia enterocolitica]
MGLELTPDTGSAANFKVYSLLCVGESGSRVFTFWQDWNSANPVPVSGGGTGAVTASQARSNLGLGGSAALEVGTTIGTVAAGDDSRIVKAIQSTNTAISLPGTLTTAGVLKGSAVAAGNAVMGGDGNISGTAWIDGNLHTHIANVSNNANNYGVVALARGASVVQSYTVEAPAGTYATNSGTSTMRYRALFFQRPGGAWVQMGGDIG